MTESTAKKYYFYLDSNFAVRASLQESPNEMLIAEVDVALEDVADLYTVMQSSVDVTLLKLDANRQALVTQKANKDIN